MFPYREEFILEKLKEYKNTLKELIIGNYKIKIDYIKNELNGYMYNKAINEDVMAYSLYKDDHKIMDISHREIESSYGSIRRASGRVGVVGLGLGYVAREMAKNPNVKKVVVYESSKEVIDLYRKSFKTHPKIKIINCDAYKAKKDTFDFFYVDIYEYELNERVVFDYKFFNELHEIENYTFCGMEHFLLSCAYDDLLYVYLPDGWLDVSRDYYEALKDSGYLEGYYELDEEMVSRVLKRFEKVFNES